MHLWAIAVDTDQDAGRGTALLSEGEQQRAVRFQKEGDRKRYTVARSTLRILLGHYLEQDAKSIKLVRSDEGKLHLADNPGTIDFSITHTGLCIVLAFGRELQVGVDVERCDRTGRFEALAKRFFHPHERDSIAALPEAEQSAAFLSCWTAKEAVLKGLGTGIQSRLDAFTVTIPLTNTPSPVHFQSDRPTAPWTVCAFAPMTNYVGALAVDRLDYNVQAFFYRA